MGISIRPSGPDEQKAKIRRNIAKMRAQGASLAEIEQYIQGATGPEGDEFRGAGSSRSFGGPEESSGLQRILDSGPARAIAQGSSFGFSDEIAAKVGSALGGPSYEQGVENERASLDAFRERSPKTALASELGGALLTGGAAGGRWAGAKGLSTLARAGRGAVVGGAAGAVSGAGVAEGGTGQRTGGAIAGGLLGAGLGAALPVAPRTTGTALGAGLGAAMNPENPGQGALAGAGAGFLGGSLLGGRLAGRTDAPGLQLSNRRGSVGSARAVAPPNADDRSVGAILDTFRQRGMTGADVQAEAQRMTATGEPVTLLEVLGDPARRLARATRAIPSRGGQQVTEALEGRAAGAEERAISGALERMGVARQNISATVDEMNAAREAASSPLYDKLRQLGSREISGLDDLIGRPSFEKAINEVEAILSERGAPFAPLKQTIKAKGGKTTTRIRPLTFDEADLLKRAMDDISDIAERPTPLESGGVTNTRRRDMTGTRAQLLDALDDAFPGDEAAGIPSYAAARDAFAGPSAGIKAHQLGTQLFSMPFHKLEHLFGQLGAAEREAFRKGAGEAVATRIESRATQDVTRRHAASTLDKRRLRLLFPDEDSYRAYQKQLAALAEEHASKRFVVDGSQTADKMTELVDLFGVGVDRLFTGGPPGAGNALLGGLRAGAQMIQGKRTQSFADAMAPRLTAGSKGSTDLMRQIEELMMAEARQAAQAGRGGTAAGATGAATGLSVNRPR